MANEKQTSKKVCAALWTGQGLLAALFLFAGVMKLIMPIEEMTAQMDLPGWFLRFIGVAETLGALGLVLPGLTRIATGLTSLAAAGLVIIMIGATTITVAMGGIGMGWFPFVVGVTLAIVGYARWQVAPHRATSRRLALQPAA